MKFISRFLFLILGLGACDLQPRIVSLPDSVGEFISARYPALLADPETEPEIYNSAVTDYGVYASPELYGSVGADDYILYASVDDYVLVPSPDDGGVVAPAADVGAPIVMAPSTPAPRPDAPTDDYLIVPMYGTMTAPSGGDGTITDTVTVGRGDTLYAISRRTGVSVDELAQLNKLSAPYTLRVGQKLTIRTAPVTPTSPSPASSPAVDKAPPVASHQTTTMVELKTITVGAGDTLYSLSRKYAVPVNDLAVMNDLGAPFILRTGQKLKVPNLDDVAVTAAPGTTTASATKNTSSQTAPKKTDKNKNVPDPKSGTTPTPAEKSPIAQGPKPKISSDPNKKLPTLSARSSSKFSWPVRGTILSNYGGKKAGLFNDGINIGASRGTAVRAAENGVVAYAGNEVKGMGNLVIVQHSGGWMTVYAHMDSMGVRRGTKVSVGQKIGTVGQTGKVTQPQLHFEIRKGTKAYNPSTYLK